ncbi:MAG: aminopeptidase P family protein [Candidatus Tectomicrobia bacterium]|uniref:Aminopeptidase P family protein n=1 Tax=Tectimicrobiota bacterium TaxID=2528274 RepID=A0A932M0T4_UNCTE|nr:aminopeptidase P family protein [Candidatus Tectomicrobia bacterium]
MNTARYPALSLAERDRRWALARSLMREEGLDCLILFGSKGREQLDRYLTNDRSGGIVIFPLEGELVHLAWAVFDLASHLESSLRGEASWVSDMRVGASGPGIVGVLREKGCENAAIGVIGTQAGGPGEFEGWAPYATWKYVLDALPKARFREVTVPFLKRIWPKSAEELALVRRAAEIGEEASQEMLRLCKPGASEAEVYAGVMNILYRNGASGSTSPYISPLILHSGPDNPSWGAPMWLFRPQPPRILKEGDLVLAEIFPRYGGLEVQIQMCVAIPPVHPVNRELAGVARRAYEAGLQMLRPGNTFGEVVKAMGAPLAEAGAWQLTPLIHSLNPLFWIGLTGVGISALPGIDRYKGVAPEVPALRDADMTLKEGMVFAFEPNACQGKHRVNIGGTVIVTAQGAEELNRLPTFMCERG